MDADELVAVGLFLGEHLDEGGVVIGRLVDVFGDLAAGLFGHVGVGGMGFDERRPTGGGLLVVGG
ncbi:MAG: hypothetical protein HQ513_06145 [Rhodospirillales bacterium]|nr:hypothetical protein [Rhodospirillales bacterium]